MKNDVDKKYGEGTYDEVIALEKRGVDLEHDDDYPEHLRQAFWFLEKQDKYVMRRQNISSMQNMKYLR